ncbi:hypothetical protein M446_2760 [Methylobacterium sp. 4-46]|uniref:hypothetical protein n=1 Tax=unclassified Methylobacterium TaxID=2615210 RepID=UPI000165C83E|nr:MULTISPECIES: hypothetical protein [Methylobacterium]ACA17198.1 hypothetical protein M446_2760 [Methylobacterium sp. 4-46]WFT82880.1 hypothetical protein QA634_13985 [Methylobacterium nodulans]
MSLPQAPSVDGWSLGRPSPALRGLRLGLLAGLLTVAAVALLLPLGLLAEGSLVTVFFNTDRAASGAVALSLLLALAGLRARAGVPAAWHRLAARPGRGGAVLAAGVAAAAAGLTLLLHRGHPLSYDEAMAVFDARIIGSGHLVAPLPEAWRDYAPALAPFFLLPVPGHAGWVSSYLPVNAALRAGFGLLGLEALTGPILAAAAAWLVVAVARRLWPARPDAAILAGLLLATAPQVLVTATTAYAMTAHLTLNLLWLRLFLRGGRLGHAGAAVVAFLACGLHQIVFHPLFALPFLAGLLPARRWRLAGFYLAAYALIGIVWVLYWKLAVAASGLAQQDGGAGLGGGYLAARAAEQIGTVGPFARDQMVKNLVRFLIWENPLVLPLGLLAWPALRRGDGVLRPLAAGLLLTCAAMAVLSPFQGHGWGYRYLHGMIGSACLLAAAGWIEATRGLAPDALARARGSVGLACLACLALVLPVHARVAHAFAAPYVAADAAIARAEADIVVVNDDRLAFAADLVRNAPDLSNRPLRLHLQAMDAAQLETLCGRGRIATFAAEQGHRLGIPEFVTPRARVPLPIPCATTPVPVP